MKRSNRLVVLVGLLLAILAAVGIVIVLNEQGGPSADAGPPPQTVLVAAEDIAIGDPITPDKVETSEVPADAVLGTPLRDPSQVQGQPALFAIPAGTQVNQAAVGLGTGAQDLSAQLLAGEKAIAFIVDRVEGVEFLVQPGDRIDILTAINLTPPPDITRTVKTVLQNKRVLYVSDTNIAPAEAEAPPEGGQAPPPPAALASVVIVFAGTDQDAEVIRMAQRVDTEFRGDAAATLSVTLRSNDDDAIEETTGITLEVLVDDYGVLVPELEGIIPEDETDTTEPAP